MKKTVKRFFWQIKSAFGLEKKSEKNVGWVLVCKTKPEFAKMDVGAESYICGDIFETEYDARRYKEYLGTIVVGYNVIDIITIETAAPITYCKYDYTDENPNLTKTYYYAE